jgi:hypothetical protein
MATNDIQIRHDGDELAPVTTLEWNLQDAIKLFTLGIPRLLVSLSIDSRKLTLNRGRTDTVLMIKQLDHLHFDVLRHSREIRKLEVEYSETPKVKLMKIAAPTISNTSHELQIMSIKRGGIHLIARFSRYEVPDMTLAIDRLDVLSTRGLTFIRSGYVTRQLIAGALHWKDEDRFTQVIRYHPSLIHSRCSDEASGYCRSKHLWSNMQT